MYIHFSPESFGLQHFTEERATDAKVNVGLQYFAEERDILLHAIMLCGLHVRILLVFDTVFDKVISTDAGWNLLKVTCDQLVGDLLRALSSGDLYLAGQCGSSF